jgi:hypothetical protein
MSEWKKWLTFLDQEGYDTKNCTRTTIITSSFVLKTAADTDFATQMVPNIHNLRSRGTGGQNKRNQISSSGKLLIRRRKLRKNYKTILPVETRKEIKNLKDATNSTKTNRFLIET